MTTKTGTAALIGGGYVLALAFAGLNAASSAGQRWLFGLVFVVGFVLMGLAIIMPWEATKPKGQA